MKMQGRPREGNFKQRTVYLDPSETDKFIKYLPRNVSLSEIIREYIRDENERIAKEKKVMAPGKGPLDSNTNPMYIYTSDKKQTTLDIFAKQQEINEFINLIEDTQLLGQMKRNAHQIEAVARTKLIKISKGLL